MEGIDEGSPGRYPDAGGGDANKVIPDIPKIKAHWERRSDPIPYLMVPLSNGEVIRYNAEIKHPGYVKAVENIKNLEGYKYGR